MGVLKVWDPISGTYVDVVGKGIAQSATDHGLLTGLSDPDHQIGSVQGLQAALDGKADDGHVHTTSGMARPFLIYLLATPPASGELNVESTGGANRTLRVSKSDANGVENNLTPLLPGDNITLTDDPETPPITGFARYYVLSEVIDQTTYWQVDVVRTDTSGSQTTTPGTRVRFIPTMSGGQSTTPIALNDLTDVDTSGVVNGEVLGYTDGTWHPMVVEGGGGGVTDHGALSGLSDDDHPHYLTAARGDSRYDVLGAASSGDTAHTSASDPHPQYLTSTEGDAAYSATGHAHAGVYDPAGTAAAGDSAHTSAGDPHPQYLTSTEGNAAYSAVGHTHEHGAIAGLADDDHTQYHTDARGDARYDAKAVSLYDRQVIRWSGTGWRWRGTTVTARPSLPAWPDGDVEWDTSTDPTFVTPPPLAMTGDKWMPHGSVNP